MRWLIDIFPYREDPAEACRFSIEMINYCLEIVQKIDKKKLRDSKEADALSALRYKEFALERGERS